MLYFLGYSFNCFTSPDFNSEDEMQQLSMSTDFLVELSDGIFAKVKSYSLFTTKIFCFIFLKVRFTCAE
jgi:hypothetical protein